MASTVTFIPPSLSKSIESLPVLAIYPAAHSPSPVALTSTSMTNHWAFYLATSADTSICVDMSPTGSTTRAGALLVSRVDGVLSNSVAKAVKVPVAANTIVKSVVDLLQAKGYDRYNFSASGQECRNWSGYVLDMLQAEGVTTSQEATAQAKSALLSVWTDEGHLAPAENQSADPKGELY